mgnify:FL=1
MQIVISVLFILITILSIIVFKAKGLLILIVTIPLFIAYFKSNDIIMLLKKKERYMKDNNLSERKEVKVVSSRDRKKGVKKEKKKIKLLDFKKSSKNGNETPRNKNAKSTKKKVKAKNVRSRDKETNPKTKKSLIRKILTILLGLAIIGIFAMMAFMIYIVISTGDFDPEALKNQDQTVVYDKDGKIFATLGDEKRESVSYDDLPQVLIDALIATEDSRFYEHNGVDMARFLKATALNLIGKDDAGGASTLTMQTVKNNLTKKDTLEANKIKKIIRKFQDVYLSVFFMEKKYSKSEILEMYVNDSCLGGRIYGVGEASKYYFGKSVSELSLPEAALLAGMYQAPNKYEPYKHPEAAQKRRSTVLNLMYRHGYITEEEKNMANAVSIESMLANNSTVGEYDGYLDTVIQEVKDKTGDDPSLVSMKIYTALDRSIQDGINDVLNGESYSGWVNDKIQAGIAVTNVNDGTIVAIGAGRNRKAGDWNYATQSYRQPGSTAKPIFDYGPGFEYNDFSTYTLFNDEPWTYTNGPEIGNWDGGYQGLITLRQALSVSRNIPALKAFQQVDKKKIASFVSGLGIDIAYSTKDENYQKYSNGGDNLLNEAYSIGGMSRGVTPLDMAEAYASFANGGYHIETHAVTKIEYRSTGKTVDFTYDKEKVMSDSTSYLMNNVLQYAVEYAFNGGARVYGSTVAAKTGTSNLSDAECIAKGIPVGSVADLWTVAYTPEYSVALWYGYEKTTKEYYLGSASAPKDEVMRAVIKTIPKTTKKWEMPSSVVAVTVEKETWPAKLPSEYTPDDMKVTEYFKKGTQPTEVSDRYAKLPIVTNLKNEKTSDGYKLTWNFKVPNVLDETYLSKYFSNSVFGKQSANYLQARLNYNNNTLGGQGFGIYIKNSIGSLERIAFVTENEYVYKPTSAGNIDIVVKAEYQNFKANASDEVKTTVKSDGAIISQKLKITFNDNKDTITVEKGKYTEEGITAKYNGRDVTKNSRTSITYEISGDSNTYKAISNLENAINKLEAGTYTITYTVTYSNETEKITRTIIIS